MLLIALALACTPTSDVAVDTDTGADTEEPMVASLAITAAPAFDPLRVPLEVRVSIEGRGTLEGRVEDAGGAVLTSWTEEVEGPTSSTRGWNGRDAAGDFAGTGDFFVAVELWASGGVEPAAVATHTARAVRAGFDGAWFDDDDGVTGTRLPLHWHGDAWLQDLDQPTVALASIEDEIGYAADFPEVTGQLVWAPAEDASQPVAYLWDSRPIVSLTVGTATLFGDTALEGAGIEVAVEGWEILGEPTLEPGRAVVLQRIEPLGAGPGLVEETLDIDFVVDDGTTEWRVGGQDLPVRIYGLLDAPAFDAEVTPWVEVVDGACRALEGVPPDHDAVADALVRWIFEDHGLTYTGGSSYLHYASSDWARPQFYLSDYLARRYGSHVNCSDCAGILTSYANMVGARTHHLIILESFDLNQIRSIGNFQHTNCPFGDGRCGFNYHAVVTDDGGLTVWDATLALDGDDDPTTAPSEDLLVQTLDGEEYLWRLVMAGEAGYFHESMGGIQ